MTTIAKPFAMFVLAAVLWGALAFGAVYPWAYWPLAAVCAALGVWGIIAAGGFGRIRSLQVAIALVIIAVAIAVQLLPLPFGLFSRVNPGAAAFLQQYDFRYTLNPPAWHSLSVSPADTAVTLILFAAFALLLMGLSRLVAHIGEEWLVTRLAMVGVGLAFFAIVQRATIDPMNPVAYGVWKAETGERVVPFGPFFNRNHFAGWMLLATPLALGYFCGLLQSSWRQQGRRWNRWLLWLTRPDASRLALIGFGVLAMGTSLVLTGSRSGVGAFVLAIAVLGYFVLRQINNRLGQAVAIIALLGLVVGAISWAGTTNALGRFSTASGDFAGRFDAWKDTVRIISGFPLFGTGLGTYGLAMLLYQTHDRGFIYFQAHNDYLQLAAEGGVLVGVPIIFAAIVLLRAISRQLRDDANDSVSRWIRVGAIAALAGIAAQSAVEFSLQMPGNTVLFVVVLALAIHVADPFARLKSVEQRHARHRGSRHSAR